VWIPYVFLREHENLPRSSAGSRGSVSLVALVASSGYLPPVSTLAEIEVEIAKLTEEKFSELLRRMEQLDALRREATQDAAFGAFAEKGGLDAAWQNALQEIEAGATTPMDVAVSYYAQGFVSMGKATELSRLSRWEFEAALADRKIERNYSKEDLEADLAWSKGTSM
jgi:predicted HTH domain antitoxin